MPAIVGAELKKASNHSCHCYLLVPSCPTWACLPIHLTSPSPPALVASQPSGLQAPALYQGLFLEVSASALEQCFSDWNLCRNCPRVLLNDKSWFVQWVWGAAQDSLFLTISLVALKPLDLHHIQRSKAPSSYHFSLLLPFPSPNPVSFTRRHVFCYCDTRKLEMLKIFPSNKFAFQMWFSAVLCFPFLLSPGT